MGGGKIWGSHCCKDNNHNEMFGNGNPASSLLVLFSLVLRCVKEENIFHEVPCITVYFCTVVQSNQLGVDISLNVSLGPGIIAGL